MARRSSFKKRLFLAAKRKKRIINVGVLKWRLERSRGRRIPNQNENTSSFSGFESEDHNNGNVPEISEPCSESETCHLNRAPSSSVNVINGEPLFFDIFEPTTSSTPIPHVKDHMSNTDRRVRRKLDLNLSIDGKDNFGGTTPLAFTINQGNSRKTECTGEGRRIVNFNYLFNKIKEINNHNPAMGCTFGNMIILKEQKLGLRSNFILKCNMCNLECKLETDEDDNGMDVNTASVIGAMAVGIGYSQLTELFSTMEIPAMAPNTYQKYHDQVANAWESTALQEMEAAAKLEIQYAEEEGNVTRDGIPILTVVADGSWAKRSYRTNYNSLSGVAAIVGSRTKKVLFLGVRNKYCTICARSAAKNAAAPSHKCYKNWSGSSASMEADIILEGFQQSMKMYGAIYGTILADGDSNVYSKIIEYRPYTNYTVDKIECSNHLLRNYCAKLKDMVNDKKTGPIHLRKLLSKNVMRLRTSISKAAKYRYAQTSLKFGQKIQFLQKDIINSPSHVFGEHLRCENLKYFCKKTEKEPDGENVVPEMRIHGMYQQIMRHVSVLADNAKSLLYSETNNPAEHFNSIVAKFIGGKRVNFSKKRSYQARCSAAVVAHNTKHALYTLHKSIYKKSPGKILKRHQVNKVKIIAKNASKRKEQRKKKYRDRMTMKEKAESKKSYGPNAQKPDMPKEEFESKRGVFLKNLERNEIEKRDLERGTVLQSQSGMWKEERRKILTASNFGTVCKRRKSTSCKNLVKQLLYTDVETAAMRYGKHNEINAISQLEETLGVKVDQCGLFIDDTLPYLGATPDGLIGADCVVEVKCPESCKTCTPDEAILKRKFTFWDVTRETTVGAINKHHNFFYQIQGQLHITKRENCYFVLWTPLGMKIEQIKRDDTFWREEMEDKLTTFYLNCVLPELIDPRHTRSMEIRDPQYIIDAIKKQNEKKRSKNQELN